MKKIFISLLAVTSAISTAKAQDSTAIKSLVLHGSVDTYYRTTLNTNDKGKFADPGTSFADGTGFNIGMINLITSKDGKKSGFVADLVFGPRGNDAGTNEDILGVVNQLYGYYKPIEKFTITLGRFNTFLGYEVISPTGNYNYSTSHLFTSGPFTHTGLKLDFAATDKFSFMIAAMDNGDNFGNKSQNSLMLGAQIGYKRENLEIYLNYLGGNVGIDTTADKLASIYNQIDLTAGYNASDDLFIGMNATYQTTNINKNAADKEVRETGFAGIAIYAQYAIAKPLSLGLRAEQYTGRNGFFAYETSLNFEDALEQNTQGSVTALTLSLQYKVGDLTIIPEFRTDIYSALSKKEADNAYPDGLIRINDAVQAGKMDLKKGISSLALAAVYAF